MRSRLTLVRIAGRQIGHDQSVFGLVCGWDLTKLTSRYTWQDNTIAVVEENLVLAVNDLRRVAKGDHEFADLLNRGEHADDVVLWTIFDDDPPPLSRCMDTVIARVTDHRWIEPGLANAASVAEFAGPVDDNFIRLRAAGLTSALEGIKPLRLMLDDLVGAPDVVAHRARCWEAMATELHRISDDLRACLLADFPQPNRKDVTDYLIVMGNNVEGLAGLAALAEATARITTAAGDLILLARDIIRGLIGNLSAYVITWATRTGGVVGLPVVTSQLAVVVSTTWRIYDYITLLADSVANLSQYIESDADDDT